MNQGTGTIKFYNSRGAEVESTSAGFHSKITGILVKMYLDSIDTYLDIGCGDCTLTKKIADCVTPKEVNVIDIKDELINTSKTLGYKGRVVDINTEPLPIESGTIDLVTCFDLVEHLIDTDHLISETQRVLKRKGYFLLSTPNLASLDNRLKIIFGYQPNSSEVSLTSSSFGVFHLGGSPNNLLPASGHLRSYTLRALENQVSYHGFITLKAFGYGGRLANHFPPIARTIILLAQKH